MVRQYARRRSAKELEDKGPQMRIKIDGHYYERGYVTTYGTKAKATRAAKVYGEYWGVKTRVRRVPHSYVGKGDYGTDKWEVLVGPKT